MWDNPAAQVDLLCAQTWAPLPPHPRPPEALPPGHMEKPDAETERVGGGVFTFPAKSRPAAMTKLDPSPPFRHCPSASPVLSLCPPLTSPRRHTSSIARSQGLALLPQNTRHPRTEPGALPTCCVTENRPVRSPGSLYLLWAPVHSIYSTSLDGNDPY